MLTPSGAIQVNTNELLASNSPGIKVAVQAIACCRPTVCGVAGSNEILGAKSVTILNYSIIKYHYIHMYVCIYVPSPLVHTKMLWLLRNSLNCYIHT